MSLDNKKFFLILFLYKTYITYIFIFLRQKMLTHQNIYLKVKNKQN